MVFKDALQESRLKKDLCNDTDKEDNYVAQLEDMVEKYRNQVSELEKEIALLKISKIVTLTQILIH